MKWKHIVVRQEVADQLDKLKAHPRQGYGEVIAGLLQKTEFSGENP